MGGIQKRVLRLFLVRHGETADNIKMHYIGIRDEPLTAAGAEQAYRAADALAAFPIRAVYTSPLKRAADTADRIRQACMAPLHEDPRLMEGSFGRWEGLSRDEVLRLGSPDVELLARWEKDASVAPPGGESLKDVQSRMLSLVNEIKQKELESPVVLVSHVGPIKALLASVMDVPLEATRHLFLDPGSISVVDWGAHPFLRLFNSHAHLGWATPRWTTVPGA
jgi:broad specificity phosphatase PhoE